MTLFEACEILTVFEAAHLALEQAQWKLGDAEFDAAPYGEVLRLRDEVRVARYARDTIPGGMDAWHLIYAIDCQVAEQEERAERAGLDEADDDFEDDIPF